MHLVLDESGTHDCRYLVIGGAYMQRSKPLANKIKRISLKVKKSHPQYSKCREVKAAEFEIRKQFIDGIAGIPGLEVRYIVADRRWVFERLNERENIFINYLMGILVGPIAKQLSAKKEPLHILFDNRSIKVGALFCMEDYLKTKIYGDWRCNIDFSLQYLESSNSYAIQGAHYVANALWLYYEGHEKRLYQRLEPKITHAELFPRGYFGQDSASSQIASTML